MPVPNAVTPAPALDDPAPRDAAGEALIGPNPTRCVTFAKEAESRLVQNMRTGTVVPEV